MGKEEEGDGEGEYPVLPPPPLLPPVAVPEPFVSLLGSNVLVAVGFAPVVGPAVGLVGDSASSSVWWWWGDVGLVRVMGLELFVSIVVGWPPRTMPGVMTPSPFVLDIRIPRVRSSTFLRSDRPRFRVRRAGVISPPAPPVPPTPTTAPEMVLFARALLRLGLELLLLLPLPSSLQ